MIYEIKFVVNIKSSYNVKKIVDIIQKFMYHEVSTGGDVDAGKAD